MELKDLYECLDLLSDYDNKPVKSRLSSDLKEKFLTANQWLEKGLKLKENAFVYEMHPSSLNKKLCAYYFVDDVEPTFSETCAFCSFYKNSYCQILGDFVSVNHRCSEFTERS